MLADSIAIVPKRPNPYPRFMRLALVISQLSAGGAERVVSTLSGYWADHGHDVTLITFWSASTDLYPLNEKVKRIALELGRQSPGVRQHPMTNWRRLWALRRTLRASNPEVVISFLDTINMLTLLASRGLGVPVIASERVHPAYHGIGAVRSRVRRLVYPWAQAVVVPSEGIREWLSAFVSPRALHVIPNPARPAGQGRNVLGAPFPAPHIVIGLGRLEPQKQFDYLLRAFARCSSRHAEWSLAIIGEGSERKNLEQIAVELGIADRVRWLGVVAQPERVLLEASIFVLSSRYEGFPNALLEAMSSGLAAVSFDCPSGPAEIIRHEIDGLLVPPQDLEGLAAALDRLMADEVLRERLGRRATEVSERFALKSVAGLWEELIRDVVSNRIKSTER
jgi:glycosyltransferase involved in cell wall biosynthesis